MTADSNAGPSGTTDGPPSQDPLMAALAGVVCSTGACHASALRYNAARTHLVVAAVTGLPFLTPGTELAAEELDDMLLVADVAPLVLPTVAFLAGSAGVEDTLAVPLRRKDGRIEGLLYLAWDDAAEAPADRTALGTVDWHTRHVTRALLAGDHSLTSAIVAHEDELVAGGIARRVERRWPIGVAMCSSVTELHRTLEQSDGSDLVLISDGLDPDVALADLAAAIRGTRPDARIVVLTRTATPQSIGQAQEAAAHGIVALDGGAPELLGVVDAIGRGATAVPPAPAVPDRRLSPRELQILRGLEEGLTYQEIATRLGVSLSTAKTQSRSLFRKLDVTSRGAAVHRGRSEGLL